ncbi:hypothetical protein JCM8115_003741 [Rhodotorula mucilaginosa]
MAAGSVLEIPKAQTLCMGDLFSDEDTDDSDTGPPASRSCRRFPPEHRSVQLDNILNRMKEATKSGMTRQVHKEANGFSEVTKPLPKEVERWMVSKDWALAHPDLVKHVSHNSSDNFDAEEWGSAFDVPLTLFHRGPDGVFVEVVKVASTEVEEVQVGAE